ncbi:MAG: polyhydroxyalkanoate depolymerase [Roseiarcus sp.]|uniref:polyhydroxyalkanoate depolymerase n=1 Tax=Roseiarcus sp. TaxID=1969460 RepID=UPI003BB071B2
MIYDAYQGIADVHDRVRKTAENAQAILNQWSANPFAPPWRRMAAYYELVALAGFTHARPDYGIDSVERKGEQIPVEERGVLWTPFCQLLRFRRQGGEDDPKVLLVAPMSGHFATLLRGTIRTLLRDHQVFITDWINPRNIKLELGGFSLEDYTQHLIDFIGFIGEDCHVVAVCQPTVSALAATAVLAQDGAAIQPASLTLIAGPIDARIAPTKVNELAQEKPIEWFRSNMIGIVPNKFEGAGRRVYPGFLQLCAFMSMNAERHTKSFVDLFNHRVEGDIEKADAIHEFYKEYFAIMDMSADFYLETVEQVFQRYLLPIGRMTHKGRKIEPRAIKRTFLLTVEGEKDDICAVGQTLAAQDLCSGLRPYMKTHHLQAGAGHYGVFNGKRWETQVYPVLRNHIQSSR